MRWRRSFRMKRRATCRRNGVCRKSADNSYREAYNVSSKTIIAEVEIHHFGKQGMRLAPKEMADMAGSAFPLRERVPEAGGEAFDWAAWYAAWRVREGLENLPGPTHLKV